MSITGDVLACLMRWGLIPYWTTAIKVGFANINAKTEGIEKLVPVDNFINGKRPRRL